MWAQHSVIARLVVISIRKSNSVLLSDRGAPIEPLIYAYLHVAHDTPAVSASQTQQPKRSYR
jgi:hypothetical protein